MIPSLFCLRPLGGSFAGSMKSVFASLAVIRMVMVYLESSGSMFSPEQSQMPSDMNQMSPMMPLTSAGDFVTGIKAGESSTIKSGTPGFDFDNNMPACANGVILTLYRDAGQEQEGAPCKGLFLRDDIILTTNECSKFAFSKKGNITVVPHSSLNAKDGIDPRLGFLETNLPYHYHFVDQPVRRNRMFLSLKASPEGQGDSGTPISISCTQDHDWPIAHNFPINGELIPLGHLHDLLQNDVLWEHTDMKVSHELQNKKQRWYALAITKREEKINMIKLIKKYQGPQGSIDIVSNMHDYILKSSNVLEAVDPRGHRVPRCFMYYYERYRKEVPFSGQSFFDWLDFGVGKRLLENKKYEKHFEDMDIGECAKKDFDQQTIHYFDEMEKSRKEVKFEMSNDGNNLIAKYVNNGELVPKSDMDDSHLYMWDLNEKFYIVEDTWDEEKYGMLKHSGLVAGAPALSAGKAYFGENGTVWGIDYSSGHYKPDINTVALMYQWMKNQKFNLTALHWVGWKSWTPKKCEDITWEDVERHGYDAASLKKSCFQVINSPSWVAYKDV